MSACCAPEKNMCILSVPFNAVDYLPHEIALIHNGEFRETLLEFTEGSHQHINVFGTLVVLFADVA